MSNQLNSSGANPSNVVSWFYHAVDWLADHQRIVLMVGVAVQLVVLSTMVVRPLRTLSTGDTILLRVVPVDPRDLFRGDYVILSYEISRILWNNSNPALPARPGVNFGEQVGRTIYVTLEQDADGKHWRPTGHTFEQPASGKFIRGTVTNRGTVEYGIESFFVQEGHGREYENAVRSRRLSAEVAVDSSGSAQLKRLVIDP